MAFTDPEAIIAQLNLEPGLEVADLGSGAGYYSVVCARLVGEEGKVYAVDIQSELLTKSKTLTQTEFDNIEYLQGDLEEEGGTHIVDSGVDLALLANTLFQAENPEAMLTEAFRILRRGGRLVLVDWSDSFGGLGPQPEQIITRDDALALAEAIGFSFESDLETGDHHWGCILGK